MSRPPTTINISGNGWVAPDKSAQIIEVGLGHEPSQWIETEFTDSTQIKSIAVDCAKMHYERAGLVIRIRVRNPGRPSAYGEVDERLLGFKCRAVSLFA
jgi:hypothetical protein